MFGDRRPRDIILFGLTAVVALLLIGSFLFPHGAFEIKELKGLDRYVPKFGGKKADWHFGWSVEGLSVFVSILNFLVGAVLVALLFLKLPKVLKAFALIGAGVFLIMMNTLGGMAGGFTGYPESKSMSSEIKDLKEYREEAEKACDKDSERACESVDRIDAQLDSISAGLFSGGKPFWFVMLIAGILIAMAVAFALNSDGIGGQRTWRTGLGILAGGAMLSLAVLPFPLAPLDSLSMMVRSGFESGAVRPGAAFIDLSPWAFGDHEFKFKELMYLYARTGVMALGPAAGALLIFHSIFAMVRPEKALRGVGAIAATVFALWIPACYFIADLPLVFVENISVPITHSFFFAAPALYGAVIGIGALHLGDALAENPDMRARLVGTLKSILYGIVPNGVTTGAPVSMAPVHAAPAPAGPGGPMGPPQPTQPQPGAMPPGGPAPHPVSGYDATGATELGDGGGGMGHDATAAIDISQLDEVISGDRGAGGFGIPESADGATAAIDVASIDALMQGDRKPAGGGAAEPADGATAAIDVSQIDALMQGDRKPAGGGAEPADGATAAIDVSQIDALMQGDRKKGENIGFASTATWDSGTFGDVLTAANQARNQNEIQKHLDAGSQAWYAKDWPTARTHYEAILMIDGQHVDALRAVAELHYYEGDLDASEQYYKRVLTVSPHDEASLEALRQIVRYRQGG